MSSVQTIRFCKICDNKLYHQVTDDNLLYYCRICGETDSEVTGTNVCVLNIQYNNTDVTGSFETLINRYTKYDPTLPHLSLPCPNEKCKINQGEKKDKEQKEADVIYIRYDNANMSHLYMCTECDYLWKSNK